MIKNQPLPPEQQVREAGRSPEGIVTTTAGGTPADLELPAALAPVLTVAVGLVALIVAAGVLLVTSPGTVTAMLDSVLGAEAHGYWYLSRATAFVSYGLLWWSMVLGLAITNRLAQAWPGGPTVSELHEHASLLGLAFGALHALALLGDHYIGYSLADVLIPFAGTAYRPLWVGLGQVAFYLLTVVTFSFYVRRWIGARAWRAIHGTSFGLFALALLHGLFSGTDSGVVWARWLYIGSAVSVAALTAFRLMVYPRRVARRTV